MLVKELREDLDQLVHANVQAGAILGEAFDYGHGGVLTE